MWVRSALAICVFAAAAPALAQTYTFSCQPDSRTVNGEKEPISLGDQFLGVGRRVFSFDEKAGKACELNASKTACLPGALWSAGADGMFTQASFNRPRAGSARVDIITLRIETGSFSANFLEGELGEVKYSGKCETLTKIAVAVKAP